MIVGTQPSSDQIAGGISPREVFELLETYAASERIQRQTAGQPPEASCRSLAKV